MKKSFSLTYQDEELLVVNKAPGVLSVPDRYDSQRFNLATKVDALFPGARPVHRLDRDTSGLLIFARTKEAFKHLSQQMERRLVEKEYLALLRGIPSAEGIIDKPLLRVDHTNRVIVNPAGKESKTEYTTRQTYGNITLVQVKLHTGRTHQIRVHFQSIGCPLLVDQTYGFAEAFYLSEVKPRYRTGKNQEERPLLDRVPLHAHSLRFMHPQTNQKLTIEAELPKDMRAVLNQLEKRYRNEID